MKTISLIAAMADNNVIGNNNQLPWHLPQDLKHFKALTLEKSIIMGRKTYESIGKPLPQRQNIIITNSKNFHAPGCDVTHSLQEAITQANSQEVMIIGGGQIYQQALPLADTLYLTRIHFTPDGDAYFPTVDFSKWQLIAKEDHPKSPDNPISFSFETYQKNALT